MEYWEVEGISGVMSILSSVAVILTAGFFAMHVYFIENQIKMLESRNELDSRREAINSISNFTLTKQKVENRRKFADLVSSGVLDENFDYRSSFFKDHTRLMRSICNDYEILAFQCEMGLVEKEFLERFWGHSMIRDYLALEKFIDFEKERTQDSTVFCDFKKLALEFIEKED